MNIVDFPSCCGITLHVNFGNTPVANDNTNYSQVDVDNYLSKSLRCNSALNMLVLNHDQNKKLSKVVKARGFKCFSKSYHPSHDSYIYVYIKNNKHTRRKFIQ